MVNVNSVILGGNLTRDPEVRYTPQGTAVANFSIAVNRTYRNREGEKKEEVCFIEVEAWRRQAETCGEFLKKGSPVLVEGRLCQERWETNEGQKRSKHKIRAIRVQFLPRGTAPPADEAAPSPAPYEEDTGQDFSQPDDLDQGKEEDEPPF